MTVPAMLDLIVQRKRQLRQDIFREMDLLQMVEAAKRLRVSLRVWFEQEVERRMKMKHPFYNYRPPRIGHSRYRR
jgi:hypothetical protein